MLVYGRNVAKEILKGKQKVLKIILQDHFDDKEIISLIEMRKISVQYCSKKEIDHLVDGVHQGIILFIPDYQYQSLDKILESDPKFLVLLDHLEDPHNLGAIIRTCDAASVDAIVMPKDREVLVNGTVMKTSVGAFSYVNICTVPNLVQSIQKLKNNGFWIVGTALDNSVDYRNVDYSGKVALVIGNEANGISRLVRESCDFVVKIPMYGKVNSLNASVASGIMIYEVIRNRK